MNRLLRCLVGMLLTISIVALCGSSRAYTVTVRYPASDAVLVNPFIGNAVWASSAPEHAQPFTLVYADLVWADFEPEQGIYDYSSFEDKNHFALWRALGKKVIFRFVMDVPTEKKHRDIPEWLYKLTNMDGKAYHVTYGRGYSPNYENPVLIDAHAKAIAALGVRYRSDPLISYIEIGSLGHWGEWHVHDNIGTMPPKDVREKYVMPYIEAFPNAILLMRRPFAIAATSGMGLFNDTSGALEPTEKWLSWIAEGANDSIPDENYDLAPMPDAWRKSPIGGELATDLKRELLLGSLFTQTLDLFKRSHTSWIGPGSFSEVPRGGDSQGAINEILNTIGYRLRVDRCTIDEISKGILRLTMVWKNDGVAPFYFDWQPTLSLNSTEGTRTLLPLPMRLIDVQPGLDYSVSITLPQNILPSGDYCISVGILDPVTKKAGVALAMTVGDVDLWYELLYVSLQ